MMNAYEVIRQKLPLADFCAYMGLLNIQESCDMLKNIYPEIPCDYNRTTLLMYNLAYNYKFFSNKEFIDVFYNLIANGLYRNLNKTESLIKKNFKNGSSLKEICGMSEWAIREARYHSRDLETYSKFKLLIKNYIKEEQKWYRVCSAFCSHGFRPKEINNIKYVVNNIMSIDELLEWIKKTEEEQAIYPVPALDLLVSYYKLAKENKNSCDIYTDSLKKSYDLEQRNYYKKYI